MTFVKYFRGGHLIINIFCHSLKMFIIFSQRKLGCEKFNDTFTKNNLGQFIIINKIF